MSNVTPLSSGTINGHDQLIIELIEPTNHPAVVRIMWPAKPSIIPPTRFSAVAADIARIVASAATRHSQLRAHGR